MSSPPLESGLDPPWWFSLLLTFSLLRLFTFSHLLLFSLQMNTARLCKWTSGGFLRWTDTTSQVWENTKEKKQNYETNNVEHIDIRKQQCFSKVFLIQATTLCRQVSIWWAVSLYSRALMSKGSETRGDPPSSAWARRPSSAPLSEYC